ncbi:MAG: hypothetical protein B7X91_06510 [Hydrogenophilales bacterium 17-64-11]|nr:MAG: hypothetical protein B7X91_06510 [Hydrogenophilales bacterium 17-64-11]
MHGGLSCRADSKAISALLSSFAGRRSKPTLQPSLLKDLAAGETESSAIHRFLLQHNTIINIEQTPVLQSEEWALLRN